MPRLRSEHIFATSKRRTGSPEGARPAEGVARAGQPQLFSPRKKTLPLIAFFTVMLAGVGLAFVLENLRPRVRAVEPSAVPLANVSQRPAS